MRIGFVGCGAIGSCYASYLSRKHEVCVLDTYAPVIESIKKNGILLDECAPGSGTGETVSFRPAMATTDPKEIGVVDLLIVFVHYQYLEAAVRNALPMIDRHTMILCLQNGLGNYDEIAKVVPEEQIIIGNTAFGATPVEPGHVKHTGTGVTNMGSLKAPKENVERMAEAGVKYVSLTNLDTIAQVGAEEGYIAPEDVARLLKFRDNPSDESWINGGEN